METKTRSGKHIFIITICAFVLALSCIATSAAFAQTNGDALQLTVSAQAERQTALTTQAVSGLEYSAKTNDAGWLPATSNYGIAGKTTDPDYVTSFKISLSGDLKGAVTYRALPWYGTWTAWKTNGKAITSSSGFEAIEIKLIGEVAEQYNVVYRANLHNVGWQRRMYDGGTAGVTSQQGYSWVRALRVKLVPKEKFSGWSGWSTSWGYWKNGEYLTNCWVSTNESPINDKLGTETGKKKYWLDAGGYLALDRVIDPWTSTDAAAKHAYYVNEYGYAEKGSHATSSGIVVSAANGRLYAKTCWLMQKGLDGKKHLFRLKKTGSYAIARTGMFKVKGKKYYAWPDTGEVMRSKSWWLVNGWYTANSQGVLKKSNNKKVKHIERYVKWAIKIAKDDSHGYSQYTRWGPDYDCSSLVVSALKKSGFRTGNATYTGNMYDELTPLGFRWYTDFSKLRRGDIMLAHNSWNQHTEIYIGNGQLVGATSSETGGIAGQVGDQTGQEIRVGSYYNMPWDGYLRYIG